MDARDILNALDLRALINGPANNLRYVVRFNAHRRQHMESVAEHQFFTAFFTLLIAEHVSRAGGWDGPVDIGLAVKRALVHDVEEQATGDILRPVKNRVREAVEEVGRESALEFFRSLTSSRPTADYLYTHWQDAKDQSVEGRIVAFADFLSVLAYLNQEVKAGNRLIMDSVKELVEYSQKFDAEEFDFIRPLCESATNLALELNAVARP